MMKNVKKKYLQWERGVRFFFGNHWDPNEPIQTGFALIPDLRRKIPLRGMDFEKKTGLQRGLDSGFFFGGHWDPNEDIPTGFALILIISQIAFFGTLLPPVKFKCCNWSYESKSIIQ